MDKPVKSKASEGERLLEEAVMDVLLKAKQNGEASVGATEIARRAGISEGSSPAFSGAFVSGALGKLYQAGEVEPDRRGRTKWRLAD